MNKELLLKVREKILESPERFDMRHWDCGTTRCIAGWAVLLHDKKQCGIIWRRAIEILNITTVEAESLFLEAVWPRQFQYSGLEPESPEHAAKRAADYITYFINNYANEN